MEITEDDSSAQGLPEYRVYRGSFSFIERADLIVKELYMGLENEFTHMVKLAIIQHLRDAVLQDREERK